jgi:hypothetical protein
MEIAMNKLTGRGKLLRVFACGVPRSTWVHVLM